MKKIICTLLVCAMAASSAAIPASAATSKYLSMGFESAYDNDGMYGGDGLSVEWRQNGYAGSNGCLYTAGGNTWSNGLMIASAEYYTDITYEMTIKYKYIDTSVTSTPGLVIWSPTGCFKENPTRTVAELGNGWREMKTEFCVSDIDSTITDETIKLHFTIRTGTNEVYYDDCSIIPKEIENTTERFSKCFAFETETADSGEYRNDGGTLAWVEGGASGSAGCVSVTATGWSNGLYINDIEFDNDITYNISLKYKYAEEENSARKPIMLPWGLNNDEPLNGTVTEAEDGWKILSSSFKISDYNGGVSGKTKLHFTIRTGTACTLYYDDILFEETIEYDQYLSNIIYANNAAVIDGDYIYAVVDEHTVRQLSLSGEVIKEYVLDTEIDPNAAFKTAPDNNNAYIITADNGKACVVMNSYTYTLEDGSTSTANVHGVTLIDFNQETPSGSLIVFNNGWGGGINAAKYSNGYIFVGWSNQGISAYTEDGQYTRLDFDNRYRDISAIDIFWENETNAKIVLSPTFASADPVIRIIDAAVSDSEITMTLNSEINLKDAINTTNGTAPHDRYAVAQSAIHNGKLYVVMRSTNSGDFLWGTEGVYVYDISGKTPVYLKEITGFDGYAEGILPYAENIAIYTSSVDHNHSFTSSTNNYLYILDTEEYTTIYRAELSERPYMAGADEDKIFATLGKTGFTYMTVTSMQEEKMDIAISGYAVVNDTITANITDPAKTGNYIYQIVVSNDGQNWAELESGTSSGNIKYVIDSDNLVDKYIGVKAFAFGGEYERAISSFDGRVIKLTASLPDTWNAAGMMPGVTVTGSDASKCAKSFKAVIAYYGDYNGVDELIGTKTYDYTVSEGFTDNTLLEVPENAVTVRVFLIEDLSNVKPLSANAELNK